MKSLIKQSQCQKFNFDDIGKLLKKIQNFGPFPKKVYKGSTQTCNLSNVVATVVLYLYDYEYELINTDSLTHLSL